jgi:hypothetical protein
MTSQLDMAREALAQIGTRSSITALDDGSPEATYVSLLYAPIRDFLLRDGDYDFSLQFAVAGDWLAAAFPWTYAYKVPLDSVRIRQLIPLVPVRLDPRPVAWNTANGIIFTAEQISGIVYTGQVDESLWDAMFCQSFVRMLASALAFALENRIEASKVKLDEALGFAGINKLRDS